MRHPSVSRCRAGRGGPPTGLAEGQAAGVPAGKSPADEVAGLLGVGELAVAHPAVQVSLGEGGKGEPSALQQVKNGDGRPQVAPPPTMSPRYAGRVTSMTWGDSACPTRSWTSRARSPVRRPSGSGCTRP